MADEQRDHFTAVLEELRDQFKVFGEGQAALRSDFQGLARTVGILNQTVDQLVDGQGRLVADVSVLKSDVSVLKSDVSVLKTDVSVLKTDVSVLKTKVTRVERHLGLNGVAEPKKRRPKPKK